MQKHSINVDSVEEMLNMVDISTTQKRRLPSYGYKLAGLVATYVFEQYSSKLAFIQNQ